MMMNPHRPIAWLLGTALVAACSPDQPVTRITQPPLQATVRQRLPHADASAAVAAVRSANARTIASGPALVPAGVPLPPFVEGRLYAIANIAVHDALNAIIPRFARYADAGPIVPDANAAAAVLTAAHDAIVGAAPAAQVDVDAWYAGEIAGLSGADGFARGVALGSRTAAAILANRANDGTAGGGLGPYSPGSNPGDYQFTPPFGGPPFNGFVDAPVWANVVTRFVLPAFAPFRAPRPYGATSNAAAVLTPAYTADFNEVKALGCVACAARTADQTAVALFWMESTVPGWNRIARVVAEQRNLDAWDSARLFAVLGIGGFDAGAASLEAKYFYNFWRPVTAIALAATDGNPATTPAAGWEVLQFPTPPIPDYPSGHATAGGAAAAIIEALTPGIGPSITTTSGSLPGVARTFSSVGAAAQENADSRIYIGYHFRHAAVEGLAHGRRVGAYVASHVLLPISEN